MLEINIQELVSAFLLRDKNGYAMAKALERGAQLFDQIITQGIAWVVDADEMPIWRLDEMAWEYNCPYDYSASIEAKRTWIREANALSKLYGTPDGIAQYLAGELKNASVEESGVYGGEAFHFRCTFSGTWTPESVAWATDAIQTIKNVRSVLDGYQFHKRMVQAIYAGCALYSGEAGVLRVPLVAMDGMSWYTDENGDMLLDENGILLVVEG